MSKQIKISKSQDSYQMYNTLKKRGQMGKKEKSQETICQRVIAEY